MRALWRCARAAEALVAYRQLLQLLDRELGAVPSASTRHLYEQIRRGEPPPRRRPTLRSAQHPTATGEPRAPEPGPPEPGPREPGPLELRPWHPPPDVGVFVGRHAELAALDAGIATPGRCVVTGTAGVGKTALVARWAHRVADRFPDGCLYADLQGYGPRRPAPPARILVELLRALDARRAQLAGGVDHLAARYRSLLHRRRMLVVLDNARSAEQVRPLLPAGSGCQTIVTSRDALAGLVARDGAHRVALEPLPPADAAGLLRALIGARAAAEPGAVEALAERCSRLPLALRLAAELAVGRPDDRLAGLAAEWADEACLLDLLDSGGDPRTAVRTVFSWSYRSLPPPAARAFRLLGLHPGPDFDALALAAAGGLPVRESARALATLAAAHLVVRVDRRRSRMHGLLRAYARETAERTDPDSYRAAVTARFSAHYRRRASIRSVP
jgi:hypothetical protein